MASHFLGITSSSLFHFVGRSAKIVVSGSAAATVLLFRDSWSSVYFVVCALANAVVGKLLKLIIKQPRPPTAKKSGYGMPSSHSQSIFYFFVVSSLKIMQLAPSSSSGTRVVAPPSLPSSSPLLYVASAVSSAFLQYPMLSVTLLGAYTATSCSWRVITGLHSWSQIFVGAVCGSSMGLLTWKFENSILDSQTFMHIFGRSAQPVHTMSILSIGAVILFRKEFKNLISPSTQKGQR